MSSSCIHWDTGCGQPMLKPRRARRDPYDMYYPSFCGYCYDYKPTPTNIQDLPDVNVIVKHHYIKPQPERKSYRDITV